MEYPVDVVMMISNDLTPEQFEELEHFVKTNQVNIMSMNKFSELGLMNEHGHPTDLAKTVVEETNG